LLIAGCVVQGAGAAINAPASIGLLLEVTPPTDRVRAITLWSACTTIGGASGPTLGALIIENGGWQWAIAGPAALTAVVWWVGRRDLPRSAPTQSTARLDLAGTLLATASMALLVLTISEGNNWGWGSGRTLAACVGAIVASAALVLRSLHHPEPVVPTKLFRARSFSVGTSASVVLGVMGGSIQLTQALFVRQIWHYSALKAGLAITPAPLFASLASPLAARFGSRYGERASAVPGSLLMAFSVAWYLMFMSTTPSYWAHLFPGSALNGIGVAFAFPMISAASVREVTPADLSIATAVTRAASQVGQAIGVALVLVLISGNATDFDRFRMCWWMLTGFCVAAAITTFGLGPPQLDHTPPGQRDVTRRGRRIRRAATSTVS
jgi:MFS family permease